ncbi:MAG: hypothetical protein ACKOA2_00590 [Ilumatobacteraceae bacterium]
MDSSLLAWCATHHGVVDSSTLAVIGISRRRRLGMIERGELLALFEGVYRSAGAPETFEMWCAAVCMADPSLVLSCTTAGRLWELRGCVDDLIHATTRRLTRPVGAQVLVHRSRTLPERDVVRRGDGIRLTTPARTFFDLAKHLDDRRLESVGEHILDRELCSWRVLGETVERLAVPGRPGSSRATRVVRSRATDRAPVDSDLELILLRALVAAGVEGLVTQPTVVLGSGVTIHPDLGIPDIGFFIEVDHHTWHGTKEAIDRDTARDRQLRLLGAVVERVTDTQIRTQLSPTVAMLVELIRRRIAESRHSGAAFAHLTAEAGPRGT